MPGWTYEDPSGWKIEHPQPKAAPPPQTFAPTADFSSDMDRILGKGRWKDTGDYRSPAREAQLRAQGAGTVRPGGVSAHSRGTYEAPGAHDFVPVGESVPETLAKLKGQPGIKDAFYEAQSGTQGGHIHVDMADATGWKVEHPASPGWTYEHPKPPAKPFDSGQRVGAAPGFGGEVEGELRHGLSEDVKEQYDPAHQGLVGQAITAFDELQRGIAALTVPIEQRKQEVGDPRKKGEEEAATVASMIPIPGAEEAGAAAEGVRSAVRAGREAMAGGREAAAAGEAAGLRASTLPRPPRLKPVEGDPFAARGTVKARTLPAKVELPPRTNVVGDEAKPAQRTANALYRLGGHDTDAKIELGRADTALRKRHGPETDEALYHALETPDAPMTPEVAAAKKDLDPLLQRQTAVINRLRERADPTLDPYLEDTGYVHRIKAGDQTALDEDAPRSPFESRKSLVKRADSQKQRKFIALEDQETGQRTLIDTSKAKDMRELRPGMEYRPPGEGPAGAAPKVFKVVSPTTKEIEAEVPGLSFQKSAIHNTAVNVYQLERAERNLDVLEQTLSDMAERGVAVKTHANFKSPEGLSVRQPIKGAERPKGFIQIPDQPNFENYVFDPKDAQVQELKDWLPRTQNWYGDALDRLDRLNNFMLRSNFLSPIVHPKNIAEFWMASRGGEWLNPMAYGRMAKTLGEAAREVYAMGPKYRQLLREGSALLSADSRTQKFTTLLTDTAAKQMAEDPKGFEAFRQAAGDVFRTPADMYKAFQEASHKMMWGLGDVMMMQRVLELQEKGMPIREAIRKAEEVIPNYRVPAQIMDSPVAGRILNQVFSNNRFFSVGRYHYNRMAAWGRMVKKVAVGTPAEKAEAAGQLLVVAAQAAIIAPLLDQAAKLATKNPNARVKRGGITALPDAAEGVASGREGLAQAIAQIVDFSPEVEVLKEGITQKDYFGDDIYSRFRTPASNVAKEAEIPLGQFGPLQGGIEALSPTYGPERVAGNMFGVNLPQKPPGEVKGSTARMLRRKYQKQDRNDPIVQGLEGLSQ